MVLDVRYRAITVYVADDAADVPAAGDVELVVYAEIVVVAYRGVNRQSRDAADVALISRYRAEVVGLARDCYVRHAAYDAADVVVGAVDGADVDEVAQLGILRLACSAADDAADVGRSAYVCGVRYVAYVRSGFKCADRSADVRPAFYRAAVDGEVSDVRAVARVAEEADVGCASLVDVQAEYVVAEAVEAPGECIVTSAGTYRIESAVARRVVRVYRVAEGVPAV